MKHLMDISVKRIVAGLLLSAICAVTQAGSLEVADVSVVSFSNHDGWSLSVTGVENHGLWGFLAATSDGTFSATNLGNESGYMDGFSDNAGLGHTFINGDQQQTPFGFTFLNGQTKRYGTFDHIFGFSDSYIGDVDYDFVGGVKYVAAPVPELEIYAMMLAGLGLLGLSVRRRKSDTFD